MTLRSAKKFILHGIKTPPQLTPCIKAAEDRMWLKNLNEISKHIPGDDRFHDVKIINDCLYVDGDLKHPKNLHSCFENVCVLDYVLTDKETLQELKKRQNKMIPYFLKWVFANRFCFGFISGAFLVVALVVLGLSGWWMVPTNLIVCGLWYLACRYIAFKYFDD